jgi:hypothetical protein
MRSAASLLAPTTLIGLKGERGKFAEAQDRLVQIYELLPWGFDTADFKDANALLDERASERQLLMPWTALHPASSVSCDV